MRQITCRACGHEKPETDITFADQKRIYRSDICRKCRKLEISRNHMKREQSTREHAHIGYEENENWHLIRAYEVLKRPWSDVA